MRLARLYLSALAFEPASVSGVLSPLNLSFSESIFCLASSDITGLPIAPRAAATAPSSVLPGDHAEATSERVKTLLHVGEEVSPLLVHFCCCFCCGVSALSRSASVDRFPAGACSLDAAVAAAASSGLCRGDAACFAAMRSCVHPAQQSHRPATYETVCDYLALVARFAAMLFGGGCCRCGPINAPLGCMPAIASVLACKLVTLRRSALTKSIIDVSTVTPRALTVSFFPLCDVCLRASARALSRSACLAASAIRRSSIAALF